MAKKTAATRKQCPFCKMEVDSAATYCPGCKAAFDDSPQGATQSAPPEPEPETVTETGGENPVDETLPEDEAAPNGEKEAAET